MGAYTWPLVTGNNYKETRHMMLEIQVLAWNRHINVDPNPLFLIIGSPTSIHTQDQYRVWTCVAAKHSSNVCIFYTCFKCLGLLRSSVKRIKWLNYNYIFHMDKINIYINTVQSLNNINWTLFEFQITHTRYRPCDRVITKNN